MKKILLLGLVLSASLAWAQNAKTLNPILFVNETVGNEAVDNGRELEYNGYSYVLVQHPNLKIVQNFYGFQTLDYIPHNAAFARVPISQLSAAKRNLENAGGRVLKIKDAWRLTKAMYTHNYGDWAWADDEQSLVLWMQYHRGLSHLQIVQELQAAEIPILEERESDRQIQIILDPEEMDRILSFAFVESVAQKDPPAEMENEEARINHRISALQQANYNGGIQYDGTGITVAHNDAGAIGGNHIDFQGRFTNFGPSSSNTDHGYHTAGTIFGAGNLEPQEAGMAPGADLFYYDYPFALNSADALYNSINARLTSNSFSNGCNSGYTNFAQNLDKDANDNPNMLHVFSSGNNGGSACPSTGGRSPYISSPSLGAYYGTITGGHKQAKNVITVGNLQKNDQIAGSSSRGPATDGRIKPEVCAVGTSVRSTGGPPINSNLTYTTKTGTSMACPGVTGSLAVMMEAYKDHNNGAEPQGALMRGILMNTADDLGNAGPDFIYGYGRINIRRAYEVIEGGWHNSGSVGTGDSATFTFTIPANTAQVRFMLVWADPESSATTNAALVNDLDMEVTYNNNTFLPWVLDPSKNLAALTSLAVRKRDSLNNQEQVTLDNPSAGTATVKVRGFNVPVGGPQNFYVVAYYESTDLVITYPNSGMGLGTGSTHIVTWDAPQNTSYTVEFSLDNQANWFSLGSTNNRQRSWTMPNLPRNEVYLRVSSAFDTAIAGPYTIVQTPATMNFLAACPDSLHIDWPDAPGVSGYVVYRLGTKYMDSIDYVTTSEAWVPHDPNSSEWYALASVINDTSIGYRSRAFQKPAGVFNCVIPQDIALEYILGPGVGDLPDCAVQGNSDLPVVQIRNTGLNPVSNFDIKFQRQGNATVYTETVNRSINPGDTIIYYFTDPANRMTLLNNVTLNFDFWTEMANDGNRFNDSLSISLMKYAVASNATVSPPYTQDFESFINCSDATNCEGTNCFLSDNWYNYRNNVNDFIDFRTNNGPTTSNNTGPNFDHNPGNSSGKYLYTEASGECEEKEAMVITPCIDLNQVYRPYANIYYHMRGAAMGSLAVDVYDGRRWHRDVATPVSGDQGNAWQLLSADLSAFSGKTVLVRYRAKTGTDFTSDIAIDDFSVVDSSGIGLEEMLANGMRLFPNPNNGKFQLNSNLPLGNDTKVRITDLSGALIWAGNFEANNNGNMEFDLQNQAPGVYLLEISNAEFRKTLRLIKE